MNTEKFTPEDFNPEDFVEAKHLIDMTAGDALRVYRELQALSQNQLSARTNIPQSAISAIENGHQNIGVERAAVFARALDVHPGDILYPGWYYRKDTDAA